MGRVPFLVFDVLLRLPAAVADLVGCPSITGGDMIEIRGQSIVDEGVENRGKQR
jgi:hypothetical protein